MGWNRPWARKSFRFVRKVSCLWMRARHASHDLSGRNLVCASVSTSHKTWHLFQICWLSWFWWCSRPISLSAAQNVDLHFLNSVAVEWKTLVSQCFIVLSYIQPFGSGDWSVTLRDGPPTSFAPGISLGHLLPVLSNFLLQQCVRSFAFTLDRAVSRLAMLVGNFSASSMVSSQMAKCPVTKQLEEEILVVRRGSEIQISIRIPIRILGTVMVILGVPCYFLGKYVVFDTTCYELYRIDTTCYKRNNVNAIWYELQNN